MDFKHLRTAVYIHIFLCPSVCKLFKMFTFPIITESASLKRRTVCVCEGKLTLSEERPLDNA